MKQVYKCDFCSSTSEIKEVMTDHEISCAFNPNQKNCNTCKHYDCEMYGGILSSNFCILGLDDNLYEDIGNCPKYEKDNLTPNSSK